MRKEGRDKLVLITFQSGEGDCPQLLFPWSGISEVQTADSYLGEVPKMSILETEYWWRCPGLKPTELLNVSPVLQIAEP